VAFASFAFLAFVDGHTTIMLLCLAISGALVAFLKYNWTPSRLFMGDAGSFSSFSPASYRSILPRIRGACETCCSAVVLAVPITDTLIVMTKRVIKGKSPFYADKTHLHLICSSSGFTKRQTAVIIIAMTAPFPCSPLPGHCSNP